MTEHLFLKDKNEITKAVACIEDFSKVSGFGKLNRFNTSKLKCRYRMGIFKWFAHDPRAINMI